MPRKAVSVTLDTDNVAWLKGRAGATGESVSELLDQIVTAARREKRTGPSQSVVGSIDIDVSDPLLEGADEVVRDAFERSLGRPFTPREGRSIDRRARSASRKRRG
jgi:hypothetical protein